MDVARPDLARFPAFAAARRREAVLRAGDAVFVPAFYWRFLGHAGAVLARAALSALLTA